MNYRYPGPQSFTEEDEGLFFGRKRETKALYDLIMVQPLVVLFAKSGMGKTSLLQAGIVPRLRFTEYDPVIIRLNDVQAPPEHQALRKIAPVAPIVGVTPSHPDNKPEATLWTEIIRYNREHNGTPLLIFDQFEEIFTLYSDEQRATFVRQLADVINGNLPESIRQRIREGMADGTLDTNAVAELERTPKVKIVLSIRSDLLHYLHLLSPEIPSILRNRFELLGLRPEQAKEAIINPAAQAREAGEYASPAFNYTADAVSQILSYLSRRQQSLLTGNRQEPEIESFQLQLLCEYIERKVISGASVGDSSSHIDTITPAFYGGEPGIEQILSQFYTNTLNAIPDARQRDKARRLLEDHLVKSERRVSVDETTIVQTHGVSTQSLDFLVNKRLLRQDVRETGEYFEISHDTLLTPILKSKLDWEAVEATKRMRRLIGLVFLMLVIVAGAVGFGIWAFRQKAEAERQKAEAQKQTEIAEDKTRIAIEETAKAQAAKLRSDSLLDQVLAEQGRTRAALDVAQRKEEARKKEEDEKNKLRFEELLKQAETLFRAKEYSLAKQKYQEALKLSPLEKKQEIQSKIQQCDQK